MLSTGSLLYQIKSRTKRLFVLKPECNLITPLNLNFGNATLYFSDQQFPRSSEIACGERKEIDTACHRFPLCVPTIPIRRVAFTLVDTYHLMPQCQRPNQLSIHSIDGNFYICRFRQLIRYPCLRVEGIRIVRQQRCLFRCQCYQELFQEAETTL